MTVRRSTACKADSNRDHEDRQQGERSDSAHPGCWAEQKLRPKVHIRRREEARPASAASTLGTPNSVSPASPRASKSFPSPATRNTTASPDRAARRHASSTVTLAPRGDRNRRSLGRCSRRCSTIRPVCSTCQDNIQHSECSRAPLLARASKERYLPCRPNIDESSDPNKSRRWGSTHRRRHCRERQQAPLMHWAPGAEH